MSRRRLLKRALVLVAALPLLYLAAALLGGVIPANRGWQQPATGVTLYLRTNGVHTWIMVPAANDRMDWRPLFPAGHIRDPRHARGWLAIGFGQREFYLTTPTWADLRPGTALRAATGFGGSLIHVEHEAEPAVDRDHARLVVTTAQYDRLVAFIAASMPRGADGAPIPLLGRGFGDGDIFYEASGRYDALRTCNEWTGAALRAAGVRVGIWTPAAQGIMWRFQ